LPPFALSLSKGPIALVDSFATAAFRRSASYFLRRQKVTKKLAPNPAVPRGARNGRDQNKSPDGALIARSGLMVLVYDRPLLRSSARGDGALTATNDRFAIWFMAASIQASRLIC